MRTSKGESFAHAASRLRETGRAASQIVGSLNRKRFALYSIPFADGARPKQNPTAEAMGFLILCVVLPRGIFPPRYRSSELLATESRFGGFLPDSLRSPVWLRFRTPSYSP